MPFTKVYNGAGTGATAGDYEDSRNWDLISLRDASKAWTASGSGTNEYYVRTAANGNPGFVATPPASNGVYIAGSAATNGTIGALTAGQWAYGDNDALGYSTVYVRLTAGGDPDAQDADHVQFRQIPNATEHVRVPSTASSILSNLDQSAVAIGDFIVEEGYEGAIGAAATTTSPPTYLRIDPDRFEFNSNGQAWIDIGTAAISPQIINTAAANQGERGLYLRGTAIATLNIMGGHVGLAVLGGEVSTATTIRNLGAQTTCWIGNGVTVTTVHQYAGSVLLRSGATTVILYDGELTTQENGAVTTATMHGGSYIYKSTGNVTTLNLYGGILDLAQSGAARTIGTLNKYRGSFTILRNKEAVTITTETAQETYTESASF
jgi:hypothetical protein